MVPRVNRLRKKYGRALALITAENWSASPDEVKKKKKKRHLEFRRSLACLLALWCPDLKAYKVGKPKVMEDSAESPSVSQGILPLVPDMCLTLVPPKSFILLANALVVCA